MFRRTASSLHAVDDETAPTAARSGDRAEPLVSRGVLAPVRTLHEPREVVAPPPPPERAEPQTLKRRLVLVDLLTITAALATACGLQELLRPVPDDYLEDELLLAVGTLPAWYLALHSAGLYTARLNVHQIDELKRTIVAAALGTGVMLGVAFALQIDPFSRFWLAGVFVSVVVLLTIERLIVRRVFASLRRQGRLARRVLIVGSGSSGPELAEAMRRHREFGYEPVGLIGDVPASIDTDLPILGQDLDDIERVAVATGATSVLIPLHAVEELPLNALTRRLTDAGLHVTLSSSLRDIDIARLRAQELDGRAMFYVEPTIRTGWRLAMKRTFDVTIAGLGLVLAAPLLLGAAILIKLESPGPVLFRQRRVGRDGAHFEILKLRTMVADAEQRRAQLADHNESDGPLFKIRADPRVTRTGRVLRKLSIDEIPQFINVLRGEMSVVGPRPALPSEVEEWAAELHHRLRVLPGITGMWQVSGRSDVSFEEYKRLDLYYVDNWSLSHDLGIVCKTFSTVLRGRGAS